MRELYINNVLMDIDGEFNPTFQFRSFLFAKLQGYEAARSWETSIKLTALNRATIEQAQAADIVSTFPYTTTTVSYYDNGYPIVEGGRAYLIRIESGRAYFVFVLGETIQVLKDLQGVKLRELGEVVGDKISWSKSTQFNDMTAGFGWCNWFSFTNQDRTLPVGVNADIPFGVLHPVVTLNYIMGKIESFFGVTFIGLSSFLTNCGFPLPSYDAPTTLSHTFVTTGGTSVGSDFANPFAVPFEVFESSYFSVDNTTRRYIRTDGGVNLLSISQFVAKYNNLTGSPSTSTLAFRAQDAQGNVRTIAFCNKSVSGTTTTYSLSGGFQILPTDRLLYFASTLSGSFLESTITATATTTQAHYSNTTTGGFFPIIPNLPDITCAEFINQCAMIAGVFPFVDPATPTEVKFYSASDLQINKPNALNWSQYLDKSTDTMGESESANFALDGFAQENVMRYADYPDNPADNTAALNINNTNIELRKDFFKLFFADAKRSSGSTIIDYVLYDVSLVDGELIRTLTKPVQWVLGKVATIGSTDFLTFPDSLKFSAIKADTNYAALQALLLSPRLERETFKLTALQVSKIDVTVPIYLEQYGKYYAIMEAQIDGEYNADVTLLEI